LARYAWRRIYTLNIDDGLERALYKSPQNVRTRLSRDSLQDGDPFFDRLDYVKLNGCVTRLQDGVIFSAAEYANAASAHHPWYDQCASDFVQSTFLFIGTKLNEPLLKYHIERYQSLNNKRSGRSYVITPTATVIQQGALEDYNIQHIPGTLKDFCSWMKIEFPQPTLPIDLAKRKFPQYSQLLGMTSIEQSNYVNLLEGVTVVKSDMAFAQPINSTGAIRNFYKGFPPTWNDVVEGVPARLSVFEQALAIIRASDSHSFIPFIGPAGSGKTTLLMQLSYELCLDSRFNVYFISQPLNQLKKTLEALQESTPLDNTLWVVIDNVEQSVDALDDVLSSGKLNRTKILCATRENIWSSRLKQKLSSAARSPIFVKEFTQEDALLILEKLRQFGSWTILGQLTEEAQIHALFIRSKQQLLIALLEATYGRGFQKIIEEDYAALQSRPEKLFLLTVAVITDRSFPAPAGLVDRALAHLGVLSTSILLAPSLAGIVSRIDGKLMVRHPVYVRYLLEHIVDPRLTADAIGGLLQAFAQYKAPVIQNLNKLEAGIYKSLINHNVLWDLLQGRGDLIIPLYQDLEKRFEMDGLFWLQYGLSLRDFKRQGEALIKLRTAFSAYEANHTQHALGHQLFIVANDIDDEVAANRLVEEAIEYLRPLQDIIESDDTYPIVVLAEGHTRHVRRFQGDVNAKTIASGYLRELKDRAADQGNNTRIWQAYNNLFKFVSTGTWTDTN